jgi:hypothetical protein
MVIGPIFVLPLNSAPNRMLWPETVYSASGQGDKTVSCDGPECKSARARVASVQGPEYILFYQSLSVPISKHSHLTCLPLWL